MMAGVKVGFVLMAKNARLAPSPCESSNSLVRTCWYPLVEENTSGFQAIAISNVSHSVTAGFAVSGYVSYRNLGGTPVAWERFGFIRLICLCWSFLRTIQPSLLKAPLDF